LNSAIPTLARYEVVFGGVCVGIERRLRLGSVAIETRADSDDAQDAHDEYRD
jgi:hypothetical protein